MPQRMEIVVVGNIGIETSIFLETAGIDFEQKTTPAPCLECVGLFGGYTARGYRRLMRSTAFIGPIGEDVPGQVILETLSTDGIETQGIFINPHGTARTTNIVFREGERKSFCDTKGSQVLVVDLSPMHALLQGAQLVHFQAVPWARSLLAPAKAMGATVAVSLHEVTSPRDPHLAGFLEAGDVFLFSAGVHPEPLSLLRLLLAQRPDATFLMSMGARGAALGDHGQVKVIPPVSLNLALADTSGAGDSLGVGFLTSRVLEHRALPTAVIRGLIAARHVCALKADSTHLISKTELEHYTRALR